MMKKKKGWCNCETTRKGSRGFDKHGKYHGCFPMLNGERCRSCGKLISDKTLKAIGFPTRKEVAKNIRERKQAIKQMGKTIKWMESLKYKKDKDIKTMERKVTKFTVEIILTDLAVSEYIDEILDQEEIHDFKVLKEETTTIDLEE